MISFSRNARLKAGAFLAFTAGTIGTFGPAAQARTPFDGTWSVLILTQQGSCDRAYRYPVRITNGVVGYAGQADFSVSGKVSNNGSVSVRVARGSQYANGTGKLTQSGGGGNWRGGECSGTWTAERR